MTDTSGVSGGSGSNGVSGSSSNHDASSEASAQDAQSSASEAADAASEAANASSTADAQAAADRAAAAADQAQTAADAALAAAQANPTTENQAQAAAAQAQAAAAQAHATAAQAAVDAKVANAAAQANPTADNVAAAQAATAAASAAATAAVSAQTAADALSNGVNGAPASAIAAAPIDLSISPSVVAQLTASPLDGLTVDVPGLLNAKGQLIDTCGQVVQSVSVDRSVPANETNFAKTMEHLDRMVAGPISGPVYAASYVSAVADGTLSADDEKHLDAVSTVGKIIDAALGVQQHRAEDPNWGVPRAK